MDDGAGNVGSPSTSQPIGHRGATGETAERSRPSGRIEIPWSQILGMLAPQLVVVGILVYGILHLGYERFYGRLGIDPAAVGLNYSSILSHATGFIILLFACVAGAATISILIWGRRLNRDKIIGWIVGSIVGGLAVFVWGEVSATTHAAQAVRTGRPVAPIAWLGVTQFAIRADPVRIEVAGRSGEAPAINQLAQRTDLLYIGQANNVIVLYDPAAQNVVYLPNNSMVLKVSNCSTGLSLDPRCRERYRPMAWAQKERGAR